MNPFIAVAVVAIMTAGCSEPKADSSVGRDSASQSCAALGRGYGRAQARVDAFNEEHVEELAHPAHVGDDGFEPSEWTDFEDAAAAARRAASVNSEYDRLANALRKLIRGKGATGVGAVFALGEPLGDAFEDCYRHGLLPRPSRPQPLVGLQNQR